MVFYGITENSSNESHQMPKQTSFFIPQNNNLDNKNENKLPEHINFSKILVYGPRINQRAIKAKLDSISKHNIKSRLPKEININGTPVKIVVSFK